MGLGAAPHDLVAFFGRKWVLLAHRDLGAVVLLMVGSLAVPRSLPAPDVPPLAGLFWPWRGTVLVLCDPDARVTMVAS
jgi:hypothetical protein